MHRKLQFYFSLIIVSIFCTKCYHSSFDVSYEETFTRAIACLSKGQNISGTENWKFPNDSDTHYQELLVWTSRYRGYPPHKWAGHSGPWIENFWIDHFSKRPLARFGGFIPLFIQWVDTHVNDFMHKNQNMPKYSFLLNELEQYLRRDVIYVTVSQDDQGISPLQEKFPNLLVLSAGGYGHIPIPLVKGEQSIANSKNLFSVDIGFYGSENTHRSRSDLIGRLKKLAKEMGMTIRSEKNSEWQRLMAETKFNLAPRGFGRTSYRVAEIVQMVRIPVYLYSDEPWIPYEGSHLDLRQIGFVSSGEDGQLRKLLLNLHDTASNMTAIDALLDKVRIARNAYTYVGVIKEVEDFLSDPFGPHGGHLRCSGLPSTPHR